MSPPSPACPCPTRLGDTGVVPPHPSAHLHLGYKQPGKGTPSELPTAPKEHPKQPVATSVPCQSLLVPSRWPGQQGDGFLADAIKVFTMETSSSASKTPPKAACTVQRKSNWGELDGPSLQPREIQISPPRPLVHPSAGHGKQPPSPGKGLSPQPCPWAGASHNSPGWHGAITGTAASVPNTGTLKGPVAHHGHKTSSFPSWKSAPGSTDPTGWREGGKECKAEPRPPQHSACTAARPALPQVVGS